ncbi:glycosyl transferase, family 39 [Pseudonocardia nigra]|uniref:glycosyl transferase, family 39 n=1 Tax=Pseudonocardia nigra TaxID=1921578 RepID=UPI0027E2606B|nr:glycosyl transferase, family 39 [Pseudonocardia nigra]
MVTAAALQVKFLVVGFWAVALAAVLVAGPREMLRRPALWAGGAIAVLATVPTLLWQADNGWPQLEMGRVVAAESVYAGGMIGFLPLAVFLTGLLIGSVLAVHGTAALLRDRAYRFLGLTVLGVVVLFLVTGGRPYYVAGLFPLVWAASATAIERRRPAVWWRWVPTWPVYALSTLVVLGVLHVLPIKPVSAHADQPLQIGNFQRDEIGWPEMVEDVVAAHRAAPPGTVVVAGSYWTVSAIQQYAPDLPSYSPHRGAAFFGAPPEDSGAVLLVGDPSPLVPAFTSVRQVGALGNGQRVANLTQGTPIFLLEGRTRPWAELWRETRSM